MKVLLTGGAGYIGSHTAVNLISDGNKVLLYDNLSNSDASVINGIAAITGVKPTLIKGDVLDEIGLVNAIEKFKPDAVIHFAGLKSVKESSLKPLEYYSTNVGGIVTLLRAMLKTGVNNVVFSSSATVYDSRQKMPVDENGIVGNAANPYGETKIICEKILADIWRRYSLNVTILRYFNPIGAHPSALIGENPVYPNNLAPYITEVALGKREYLGVFGNDYPTVDGTGVRDYIHVCDLAEGHSLALKNMDGLKVYNLGTGKGSSVLEVLRAFCNVEERDIPYRIMPRREGDVAELVACCDKAKKELGFAPVYNLTDMARSCLAYARKNFSGKIK